MPETWQDRPGWFYIIQLEPENEPCLVKVGWTVDIRRRLIQHRTALHAPMATVVKHWPCLRGEEHSALTASVQGCRVVLGEVYRCDSLAQTVERTDAFFRGRDAVPELALAPRKIVRLILPSAQGTVTAQTVTKELGIPRQALYRLVDAGRVPVHELPPEFWHSQNRRRLRFKVSEVRAALDRMQAERPGR